MCYAQCCHSDGSGVRHGHYQATVLAKVIYCLRLSFVAMATVVMRDMCSGHMHYYQATMLVIA